MARRRRLNKKVALIGTTVFLLLAMAAVCVILRLNRNPAPLIADGDAAWAAKDYKTASDSYRRAYGLIRSSPGKIDLLFKLVEVYQETDQWDKVLGCWNAIVTSDPQNVKARLGQLKYCYVLADGLGNAGRSMSGYWEDVLSQARKAMEVVENAGLGNDERAKWEPTFGTAEGRGWSSGSTRLGPHLHFVKGRAAFELAAMGAVTSPGELLQEAQNDLQQAKKLDPNNPQVYRYLAEVFVKEGETAASRGSVDQKNAAEQQADEILAEAVRAAGNMPEAHINMLTRKLTVAQRGGITAAREQMKAMEPQYEGLTQKFASSPQVFAALGQFYSFYAAYLDWASGMEKLNRAIQVTEQAYTLDGGNVEYPMLTASYHYRKFSVYGDAAALNKAVELTEKALELPGAQDRAGPLQFAHRVNRLALCSLLGKCCVERLLTLPKSDPAREGLLARVEKAVHEIGQIRGSGEDLEVVKWQGMLDLAKGQAGKAVRNLYAAYEQIKAANPPEQRDPFLSWTLAKIFEQTQETGAVIDFLGTALSSGIVYTRPDALLDYGHALLRAGSYDAVLSITGVFQERFGGNRRSQALRIKALIAKGTLTDVEPEIAKLDPSDPNAVVLGLDLARARSNQLLATIRRQELSNPEGSSGTIRTMTEELRGHQKREAELVQRLLQIRPDAVEESYIAELCESLLAQGDTNSAKTIVEAFLQHAPDNVTALFYRDLLSEPDPRRCPPARRKELQEQAAGAVPDPVRRSLELGLFYEQTQQLDKAIPQLRSVLDATASGGSQDAPAYAPVKPSSPRQVAAGHLFDLARRQENWPLAGEMAEIAKRDNLDDCSGRLFAARLTFAKKEYDSALSHLNECLKQRPLFSYGYVLRSDVKAALGKEQESIEDARKASELNPMDALVARGLVKALYARNRKLGTGLSSEQKQETKQALEQAIRLDPRDPSLLSVYVDFLSDSEPEKAVALRQTIQANAPSVDNAVTLGKLATQIALNTKDETKKNAFFTMAQTAFEQARKVDPTNQLVLESYAQYFRARGQNDKAGQLLAESKDYQLLWQHCFRVGEHGEAKKLLEKMYQESNSRIDALKGLILVAEATSDREGVKKYSGELLSLEDNAINRCMQLQAYLDVGLAAEADPILRAFKEKYPGDPRVTLMAAYVAAGQYKYAEAIDGIDKCIQSAGPETDIGLEYAARKAQLLITAYNATSDKAYLRKAIGVYESLRVKWPKNTSVLNNLAYLLAEDNEKLAEALEYARTAVEQNPDEANYLDTYGYLLYRNGKHAQAAQSLAAAVQKYEVRGTVPTDVYEHLGLVNEAMGERGKALDAYRRALEVGGAAMPGAAKQRISSAIGRLTE
jgi:tetratricopeptide (TPR) repeat protein